MWPVMLPGLGLALGYRPSLLLGCSAFESHRLPMSQPEIPSRPCVREGTSARFLQMMVFGTCKACIDYSLALTHAGVDDTSILNSTSYT